jgi:ribose/xylose/arabinose/galactoside ABC-type transport system permease subunit
MNGGSSIGGFPERFVFIGNGALAGVPLSDLLLLAFLALGFFIQRFTALGNHICALGGNEAVLRQEGLSAARLQLVVFGFSGFCAAVSGLLLSAQLDTATPLRVTHTNWTPLPPASSAAWISLAGAAPCPWPFLAHWS